MISLNIPPGINIRVTEKEFERFAIANRDLRLERKDNGELIVMPPTGGETGKRNSEIIIELGIWNKQLKKGIIFDSSTGFKLSNGAIRSPDVSWISNQKWNSLTSEQKKKFLPITPEFLVELRSPSDSLKTLQDKMLEYVNSGLLLGWLIDPINKKVEIYRQNRDKKILDNPKNLSGESILPGFILDLSKII